MVIGFSLSVEVKENVHIRFSGGAAHIPDALEMGVFWGGEAIADLHGRVTESVALF
jgi:hypothetical protein